MKYSSKPAVQVVSMRMFGHAGASGYDRLAHYLDCRVIEPVAQWTLPRRAISRLARPWIRRSGSIWYHRDSLLGELHAAREWLARPNQIFHFLYGENCYRYLGALKQLRRTNRIVCTYHTPPAVFENKVHDRRHIQRLDAVITVSTVQNELFSRLVGDRVFFVPHGIDVDYFKPHPSPSASNGRIRCLTVGSYLRDLETLSRIVNFVGQRNTEIQFSVVTHPEFHHWFQGMNNVTLHARLADEELRSLYQETDIFVLPLTDCTANNGLLEAMACGLPVIATDLQGVRDYTDATCAQLAARGDAPAMAEMIIALAADQTMRWKMAAAARKRALAFRWENVAAQIKHVYEQI